jgi:hypothetical protein
MDGLIILGILFAIGYWLYRSGKREGSRKGFHVGLHRRRPRRRR